MNRKTLFIILGAFGLIAIAYFAFAGKNPVTGNNSAKLADIKARIIADENWKKQVSEKATAAGRTFEQQLEMEAIYVLENY